MSEGEPTKPLTRVEISAGAHQVVIECAGTLNAVAKKALELWRSTETADIARGYGTSVGFTAELSIEDRYVEEEPDGVVS